MKRFDKKHTVLEFFNNAVNQFGDRTAIIFNETEISYFDLNQKINKLANYLIKKGMKKGDIVSVAINRNIEVIASIFAVLKCGGAYVPIDPLYPHDRINYMLEDADASFLITTSAFSQIVSANTQKIEIDTKIDEISSCSSDEPGVDICGDDLMYILYTSGSTGKPKGTMIGHSNMVHFLNGMNGVYHVNENFRTLTIYSISFDPSGGDYYLTLTNGATLIIADNDTVVDGEKLLSLIINEKVNFLTATPSIYKLLLNGGWKDKLPIIICSGGEILTKQLAGDLIRNCDTLYNVYGPTEATITTSQVIISDPSEITIGYPMKDTPIYVLNNKMQPVLNGKPGELYISGGGVGQGYYKRKELTEQKFLNDPFSATVGQKMYKTGDLVKIDEMGRIVYLGRIDNQVKIRGYRIELGEIENLLSEQQNVDECFVRAKENLKGEKILVGYVITKNKPGVTSRHLVSGWKKKLSEALPDFMVPSHIHILQSWPLLPNGKIDFANLPGIPVTRPDQIIPYRAPVTPMENIILEVWSGVLGISGIGTDDNFFDMGGNSLLAQEVISRLNTEFNLKRRVTELYQFPTIRSFAGDEGVLESTKENLLLNSIGADIAIIGMDLHFPGASTVEEFWGMLIGGREGISFFSDDQIDASVPAAIKSSGNYIKARGVVKDVDLFDAEVFSINPKLAELMDPQQRIFLEISRNVLEKTGYLFSDKTTGVFAGCDTNSYFENNVIWHKDKIDRLGQFLFSTVKDKDYVASRISYHLNLKGPAVNVNSACSTSLLAVSLAVESLRKGQCQLALAGGASVHVPVNSGHLHDEGSIFSRDGHTRSFDAESSGTVFSDGAGVVLLKPLQAAIQDGDFIYAVIKGTGVNNDGGNKASFSAPSAVGQAASIDQAINDAKVDPADISYIEAHGTATPLGDPIEIEGLEIAFGNQRKKQYCAIGSAKSNIGHLTHAAGVAGLIKAALSLHNKKLPASINCNSPNPQINWEETPFYVNNSFKNWESAKKRIAGVSSFGVGGTNVHLIVGEYIPKKSDAAVSVPGPQIIAWSTRDRTSISLYAEKLRAFLTSTNASLSDISYTLLKTRQEFNNRVSLVANSKDGLLAQLNDSKQIDAATVELAEIGQPLVFMFPGQGSQYVNMGKGLYESEAAFKMAVDECAEILKSLIGEDIRDIIYKEHGTDVDAEKLKNTFYTQPAIFVTSYAIAKLFKSYGISPAAMVGHSVGEFVAAHLSGIMSLTDALTIVANRARLISELPSGSMLSVQLSAQEVKKIIPENISIAANNAPGLCVISGTHEAIDAFAFELTRKEIQHKKLLTSHAFHSSMMDPILKPLQAVVENVKLQIPRIPILSTVTGVWLNDNEATSPKYWANHARATVNFSEAILKIEEDLHPLFVEAGPGTTATILAKRHGARIVSKAFNAIDSKIKTDEEFASIKKLLGRLWQNGIEIDMSALFKNSNPKIIHQVPTYAYNKKRYWLEAPLTQPAAFVTPIPINITTLPENNQASFNEMSNYPDRKDFFIEKVKEILEKTSGIDVSATNPLNNFMEIGLDSLILTQIASGLKKEFQLPITFRMLNEDLDTIDKLAAYLDKNSAMQVPAQQPPQVVPQNTQQRHSQQFANPLAENDALSLIAQQINLLSQQVMLLQNGNTLPQNLPVQNPPPAQFNGSPKAAPVNGDDGLTIEEKTEIKKPFGAIARIETKTDGITDEQKIFLAKLIEGYNKKTPKSKAYTQRHRPYMADPRVVSGFKPATKEMIYSIVVSKSKGCHLWDIDGNEYVDALNGFGSNFLGYQADVLKKAMIEQIEKGYEIGPQHELAGEVCKLISEMTGMERIGLCNTGSEAVLGAMRIARTVNNRNLIVAFTGSYHGIVDEVLVRGTKKLKTFPAASGILPDNVQNMLILDYGTDETLEIIKNRASDIAGILVEPVQSRRPEFQPVDFLKQLRQLTTEKDIALIFDEVITGFRSHPAGAQALFGVKADLATYGKIVGGGLSLGVIGGDRKYLDALDGGFWQYGDRSVPEVGVTYFAGTFVRHPLALATAKATLDYLKEQGPELQRRINNRTTQLAKRMNEVCDQLGVPIYIAHFSSLWKIKFKEEYPYHELLFSLMRLKNIHIWDGFPCFLTLAHTDEDIERICEAFKTSLQELLDAGFVTQQKGLTNKEPNLIVEANQPPVAGAKLGRDKDGNPAWFVKDAENEGRFLKLSEN